MVRSTKDIQRALNEHGAKLLIDGVMGPNTECALLAFQKKNGLYVDGIIGPITEKLLFSEPEDFKDVKELMKFVSVKCDKHGEGYNVTHLRQDAAESFERVVKELHEAGAIVTSSGGKRALSASTGANRSQTSLHYLGIAHDLFVWSGMVDPKKDPYVVTGGRLGWTVYARANVGERLVVSAHTYDHKIVEVEDTWVNLTEIMEKQGWSGIRPRSSFFTRKNKLGAEWWHFQYEKAIQINSRFGDELLKTYRLLKLKKHSLWNHRDVQWKKDWH